MWVRTICLTLFGLIGHPLTAFVFNGLVWRHAVVLLVFFLCLKWSRGKIFGVGITCKSIGLSFISLNYVGSSNWGGMLIIRYYRQLWLIDLLVSGQYHASDQLIALKRDTLKCPSLSIPTAMSESLSLLQIRFQRVCSISKHLSPGNSSPVTGKLSISISDWAHVE